MQAVVLPAAGELLQFIGDHPEPKLAPGDELLEVTGCGVCHSDLHVVDGDFPSSLPMVLGHEVTGVHAELGPVMLYAPWGCRSCPQCDAGLEMICSGSTEAGLFTDGGYAERMRVPGRQYLAPLGDLDPMAAAPLACGGLTAYRAVLHGVDTLRSRGGAGRRVGAGRAVVIGAGGLGQFAIRYLGLMTDAEVTAIDLAPDKRATALTIGAAHAIDGANADAVAEMEPADVVIDFIGAETTLTSACAVVAKQGMIVCVGLAGGRVPFGFGAVPHEARLLTSVWGSRAQMSELIDLAHREPSVVQPVEVLPLVDAQVAHDRLRAGDVRGRFVLTP